MNLKYAKWQKPDARDHILYDFIDTTSPKGKFIDID